MRSRSSTSSEPAARAEKPLSGTPRKRSGSLSKTNRLRRTALSVQPPSVEELTSGKNLQRPSTVRGIYLDRRPGKNDVHMRFTYAAPDRWVWLHLDGAPSGAITDGKTHVIVEDGVAALVTDAGEVGATHRLMSLLNPMWFNWAGTEFGDVVEGEAIGRSAWLVSATPHQPGKVPMDLAFDQESGVLLYMKGSGSYLGFEDLFLDEELDDETFRWDGPVEPRKMGSALVIPEEAGTYSVIWEVAVKDRPMYHQNGPAGIPKDEALRWGEERAARTLVRDS